jgi:hypothetical protein
VKDERRILNWRINDLNRLNAHRYGGDRATYVFPDDDAGREDLDILIKHYAEYHPASPARIIKIRAPWMSEEESARAIYMAFAYPRRWRSPTLGKLLNYSKEEWRILKLRTITPVGLSKEDRKRISARDRMERRRRRKGSKPRALYEAKSLSRQKPWEKEGISRASWYRRHRETETSALRIRLIGRNGPVSQGREARKSEKGFDGQWQENQQRKKVREKERIGYELGLSRFQKMARN